MTVEPLSWDEFSSYPINAQHKLWDYYQDLVTSLLENRDLLLQAQLMLETEVADLKADIQEIQIASIK